MLRWSDVIVVMIQEIHEARIFVSNVSYWTNCIVGIDFGQTFKCIAFFFRSEEKSRHSRD